MEEIKKPQISPMSQIKYLYLRNLCNLWLYKGRI